MGWETLYIFNSYKSLENIQLILILVQNRGSMILALDPDLESDFQPFVDSRASHFLVDWVLLT